MIAILDYGVGNLFSITSSLRYLGIDAIITHDHTELVQAKSIILPGVGAFGDAVASLRASGLDKIVCEQANSGKPLLGICLGMQLLYEKSYEYGSHCGLGLIQGEIVSLREKLGNASKVPHMGWNTLIHDRDCALLPKESAGEFVYYVHSYFAEVTGNTAAHSVYDGISVTGVVQRDNVYGVQFHPEKSGQAGLAMLKAFASVTLDPFAPPA